MPLAPMTPLDKKLRIFRPGPDLTLEGNGDIWHFADTPKPGRRSFLYDAATDLFTDETYEEFPLSYDIDQIGGTTQKESRPLLR